MLSDNSESDVYIPAAVRRQAARAEELAREAGAANAGGEPASGEEPVEGAPEPVEPSADAPPEPELVPEPPPAAAAPGDAAGDTGWEQRYRTLQGKYDTEINQLRRDNDSFRNLLANMQRQDQVIEERAARQPAKVVIPQEDIDEYGQELPAKTGRWARAELQPEFDRLNQRQEEYEEAQRQLRLEMTRSRIENYLNTDPVLGSIWQQVDHDLEFHDWLKQVDPMTGRPRQEFLDQAFFAGDAPRCAAFFHTYIAEHTAFRGSSPAPVVQTPRYQNGNGNAVADRVALEDLAAPGRARGGAPSSGAPAEKRIWTSTDISRFFDEKRKGRFTGREAEAARLEQDIFDAQSEGRFRN